MIVNKCIRDIRYSGYCVIKNYLNSEVLLRLLNLVNNNYLENINLKSLSDNQAKDKVLYHLHYLDKEFINILTAGYLLEILKPFLNDPYYRQIPKEDPNFVLAQYNARSSVVPLPLHIDSYFPYSAQKLNSMQVVFSLAGQKKGNGATILVPGSHLLNQYPDREVGISSQTTLECEPGDVVIWDSRLWHGALGNSTGIDRWSLIATFRPWWAKQNYDPVGGLSEDIFSELTNNEKALLGFLTLPPCDENEKVSLKEGYESLLESVDDYSKRRSKNDY